MSATLDWNISECECGGFVLEWGATSVHLTAEDVARLHRLMAVTMEEFSIPESTTDIGHARSTPRLH